MKKKMQYGGIGLTLMLLLASGCQDLAVQNPNNPDRLLALAEPGDVESLVSDGFTSYWSATQWCGINMMLSTMADAHSASWANWGMRDMSSEPRIAWNNDPSYSRRGSTETPWFRIYTGISNMNDGLAALAVNEAAFVSDGIDVNRLRAYAKFSQGLLHSWLALQYDQAFVVDENVDLENDVLTPVPYTEVMNASIAFLQEAITIAQGSDFTITAAEDWIYGLDVSSADLVKIIHSYIARFKAQVARTPAEGDAVDWAAVMSHIDQGITEDFAPIGDDNGDVREWDCLKWAGNEGETWSRGDYRTIGPADQSGGYQAWLDTDTQDRLVFDIETSDLRINAAPEVTAEVTNDDGTVTTIVYPQVSGSLFQYQGTNGPFPPARGTYHYSSHNPLHYREYRDANSNGPMPVIRMTEMNLLKAEALLRTGGDLATVADLINDTRVANGGLEPATAADAVGTTTTGGEIFDPYTGSLWEKLIYEKQIELMLTAAGLHFFDDRRWGRLVSGTPLQFPMPGKELETLALKNYTFGGGGDSSAPKDGLRRRFLEVHGTSGAERRTLKAF